MGQKCREGYKMTELGEIPQEWEVEKVGDISEIIMGQSPTGESYNGSGEGIPLLNGPTEFGHKYPTPKQWTTKPTKFSRKNDVLFCVRGSSTGRMNFADGEYCIGRGLAAIRGSEGDSDTRFIYYGIQFNLSSILNLSAGSTFPNVGRDDLKNVLFAVPVINEQQKIADILSTVDEQIEQTDALIEKTKELKKGLMQRLLTKGIRHTEFRDTDIGRIPVEWGVTQLSKVASINPTYKLVKGEMYDFVDMASLPTEGLSISEIREREYGTNSGSKFKNGDTLFARITPCAENGKMAYVDCLNTEYGLGSTEFVVISPKKDLIAPLFLFYCMRSERVRNYAISRMLGTTGRQRISNEVFKEEIKIAVPPLTEQKRITECLSSIDRDTNLYEKKKNELNIAKKSLMQQLLTGKIRVKI